ncbi:MAG: GNAT family N-acetyltransferase [Candidatus Aenigmarchaeota archaeon]|nr:GNAT family N-acetyltransferase [Candidatus Aenigmarchaeota archaeon]
MIIRKIKKSDAKQVAKLLQKEFGPGYKTIRFKERWVVQKIKYPGDRFLVAIDSNQLIGNIRACLIDYDLAELRNIVVAEEWRKKGIGTKLVKEMLKKLKKEKVRKVIIKVIATNKIAINMFKKLGFVKEGHFHNHFRNGEDVIQMCKFL